MCNASAQHRGPKHDHCIDGVFRSGLKTSQTVTWSSDHYSVYLYLSCIWVFRVWRMDPTSSLSAGNLIKNVELAFPINQSFLPVRPADLFPCHYNGVRVHIWHVPACSSVCACFFFFLLWLDLIYWEHLLSQTPSLTLNLYIRYFLQKLFLSLSVL